MCVDNKEINVKQCTIAWYVENNKVSNCEQDVINDVINKEEGIFIGLMATKGNTYKLLGMKTRHIKNKRAAINIKEYIL